MCQSCFTAFRAKARVVALRIRPTGAILALLRQGAEHRCRLETTIYGPQRAVDCDVNLHNMWPSAPDRGTVFSCTEYQSLRVDP